MFQISKVLHAPLHSLWAWFWALLASYERLIGFLAGATAGVYEGLARAVAHQALGGGGGGRAAPSASRLPPSCPSIPVIACIPDAPLEPLPEQLSSESPTKPASLPPLPAPKLATGPAPVALASKPTAVAGPTTPTRPGPVSVEALPARHEHVAVAPSTMATSEAAGDEKKKKRHRGGPLRKAMKGVKHVLRL